MFRLGRLKPDAPPKLHFKMYKTSVLPSPPLSTNYGPKAAKSLGSIYCNDDLGDCVIAAGYHYEGLVTANAGSEFIATKNQIIKDYGTIGGYIPGKPSTDQGCDEQTAFKIWTDQGFADGNKLFGFMGVDATNPLLCKQALWLFENLFFGMALPDKWISPFPSKSGFVWDVAGKSNPKNGHAVLGYDFNSKGILIDSWGLRGLLTWAAVAKYAVTKVDGELYSLLSVAQLIKATQKSPGGLDWPTLITDFQSV